jgi:acyl-CoA synthetase (AMP-forming)/AMP-acid ligase II
MLGRGVFCETFFWATLEQFGEATALIDSEGGTMSYSAVCSAADHFVRECRDVIAESVDRPLLAIRMANRSEPIIAYLGALRAGWPVILLDDGSDESDQRILATYRPNAIYTNDGGVWALHELDRTQAPMHPDLAILLSTSGTTGSPKLVRLSQRNIASNTTAICAYLGIQARDRAMTSLPCHYSYGMSVLNTYLHCGASLLLTDRSVLDDAFWRYARDYEVTSLALVPFQFELLEKTGFDWQTTPSLRYLTQAGGRLPEPLVQRFASLGRANGWRLFVMYGQTEASPRMAYLPPEDAEAYPGCIGRPIPGGRFELIDADGAPVSAPNRPGELVYNGPNVMLGYARTRDELAAPAGAERLRTGDIAELTENGYYRIVGRLSRFVKLFGLRISLDEAEELLRREGITAWCAGKDDLLVIFLPDPTKAGAARALVVERYKLTDLAVRVQPLEAPPLLPSGKIDYKALTMLAETLQPEPGLTNDALEAAVKSALRTDHLEMDKSFTELGGDSLSYIEVQMTLARRLGQIPDQWEAIPLRSLLTLAPVKHASMVWLPVSSDIIARIAALTTIIMLHSTSLPVDGGVYLLTLLIGSSLARFQMATLAAGHVGSVLRSRLVPITICYFVLIAAETVKRGSVGEEWFLLIANFYQQSRPPGLEPYWFVCTYVQVMLLIAALFLYPPIRIFIANRAFEAGVALFALSAAASAVLESLGVVHILQIRHPVFALQLVALGWCCSHSSRTAEKLITSVLLIADVLLWWRIDLSVTVIILVGGLFVIWIPSIPAPAPLAKALFAVGSSAMFIYLVHPVALSIVDEWTRFSEPVIFSSSMALAIIAAFALKTVYQYADARARAVLAAMHRKVA